MDAAVFWIPDDRAQLHFAAARLSMVVTRRDGGEPVSVDGDRVGVGYVDSPESFEWTSHRLDVAAGQRFIIVTDGVIDQIGGPRGLALGRKRLVQHLHGSAAEGAEAAGRRLESFVTQWQGEEARRDDVTALMFDL